MSEKKILAILADFPAAWLDASLAGLGWHHAPAWLAHVKEFLSEAEQYETHWIIFSPTVRKTGTRTYQNGNQTFHVVPRYSLKWDQRFHYLYARWSARRILKRIKPDIVHSWGTEAEYAVAAMDCQCTKILSMQGILTAILQRSPMGRFSQLQARYERCAMRAFDVITSESDWGCDRVREIVPDKKIVRWEYAPDDLCSHYIWEPALEPCCVLAGMDKPMKNIEAAVKAFSSPELSHVTLYMAGVQPENHPNLPPNIKALGGIPRAELLGYMSRAWCLVHPSLADTSPNVVKEARLIGLPVVVSNETGGTQYVEHGKSGYIFDPHDIEALKRHVGAVVASRETALQMGRYGHDACLHALSKETMRKRLFDVYEEACRTGRA